MQRNIFFLRIFTTADFQLQITTIFKNIMPIYTRFQEVYVKNFCVTALGNAKHATLICDSQNFAIKTRPINVGKSLRNLPLFQ